MNVFSKAIGFYDLSKFNYALSSEIDALIKMNYEIIDIKYSPIGFSDPDDKYGAVCWSALIMAKPKEKQVNTASDLT